MKALIQNKEYTIEQKNGEWRIVLKRQHTNMVKYFKTKYDAIVFLKTLLLFVWYIDVVGKNVIVTNDLTNEVYSHEIKNEFETLQWFDTLKLNHGKTNVETFIKKD